VATAANRDLPHQLAGEPAGESTGVRSIQRALDILSLLTADRPALVIRDIVEATGLARTTVVRIVQTLEQNGLLWATPTDYVAGPGLLRWAHLAQRSWELSLEAQRAMRDLADQCGETVNLFVARGISRVCVARQEGPKPLRHVIHIGEEQPLWGGASSKILLRDASDDLLNRVADSSPFGSDHAKHLRESADEAAGRGHAVSRSEHDVGLSAVAVPVTDGTGAVVASLSLSGPTVRIPDERVPEFAAELAKVAQLIGERGFHQPHTATA
jgi:DNA-binding IclR family transcriptional regulator